MLPPIPEKIIMAESGIAPSRGRRTPPIIEGGSPKSSNNSAPSKHQTNYQQGINKLVF